MALAHKPPTGLAGSVTIHLPAFKRKRIEQWCEDVAHYLRTGSLCRSVIGHVIEDNRALGGSVTPTPGYKSAPPGIGSKTTSVGTMTDNGPNSNKYDVGIKVTKIECTAPPPGRGTPMPDASGPLPVVKFSYSHYNEQRRKIDRLVQGLPVLSSNAQRPVTPGAERVNQQGAVVYVNGEEPTRGGGVGYGSAGSGKERERVGRTSARASPVPASRSSSGEHRLRGSVPPPASGNVRNRSHSPGPAGRNGVQHHSPGPSGARPQAAQHTNGYTTVGRNNNAHRSHSPGPYNGPKTHHYNSTSSHGNTLHPNHAHGLSLSHPVNHVSESPEIVVIEDPYHHGQNKDKSFSATGFRTGQVPSGSNFAYRRSPNVNKARQKIVANSRKSLPQDRDVSGSTQHLPVQNCWAMAELTW